MITPAIFFVRSWARIGSVPIHFLGRYYGHEFFYLVLSTPDALILKAIKKNQTWKRLEHLAKETVEFEHWQNQAVGAIESGTASLKPQFLSATSRIMKNTGYLPGDI